jgi:RimJ/RimL family protein N-acetyltransferase
LAGKQVRLRPWSVDDAQWYVDTRDDEVFRWTTESRDLTLQQATAGIAGADDAPDVYSFAIADRDTDELLGNLPVRVDGTTAVVAYWLAPAARGRGLLADALDTLLEWLPSVGLTAVILEIDADNAASRGAAARAGFALVDETANPLRYERALTA